MPATAPPTLGGLIPATVTPMHADGSIHPERIDALVEHYARDGADGLFVCGTTGESVSLSTEERMRLTERWCAAARDAGPDARSGGGGGLPVGVNVTHTSLPDCKALAAHAAACGAAGFAAMAPFYFKPRGADEVVAFCAEVAAAAPGLPFYYYHYPAMTGVTIPVADVLARAADRIPNLVGFKNSGENLIDVGNAIAVGATGGGDGGGRFTPLFGSEAMMLGALALGVRDHIGGTYNFALPVYRRLLEAFDRGDLPAARAAQALGRTLVNPLRRHDFQAATKAVMRMIGLDCGPARLPLRNLGEAETAALLAELERAGLFEERQQRRQTT